MDALYRVSRKTLYAFYFAITQLMMHRGFSSWTFSNSPFRWLLEIVQNFKDWAIFDQVMKEILTETKNKKTTNLHRILEFKNFLISHHPQFSLFSLHTIFNI